MKKYQILGLNLIFAFIIAFVQNALASAPKEPLYFDLSKTLGFIMGQQLSLNRIGADYPALSLQVKMAELEFNITFGKAENNIKKEGLTQITKS